MSKRTAKKPARSRPRDVEAPKPGTRSAALVALLGRKNGASLEDLLTEFGWQPHTARAAVSMLGSKRGYKVERRDGRYFLG